MKTLNKQQGFTLVELIIVIVILGILAVTAAPRFLNFQGDAKASVLEGVAGSLKSGLKIVEGKAIIAGLNKAVLACLDANSNVVEADAGANSDECDANEFELTYGSPALEPASVTAIAEFSDGIVVALEPSSGTAPNTVPGTKFFIANNTADLADTDCRVEYTPATSTVAASVVVNNTGCN